jgi:hypothetical protein
MGSTRSGGLLPPQLLYEGKTQRCHAKGVDFPSDWNVHHSSTHWSNSDTMKEYVNKVLIPYADMTKKNLSLDPSIKPLLKLIGTRDFSST